jgi:hypothetical protein
MLSMVIFRLTGQICTVHHCFHTIKQNPKIFVIQEILRNTKSLCSSQKRKQKPTLVVRFILLPEVSVQTH